MNNLKDIPLLGVGIGLRDDLKDDTASYGKELDVLEIVAEHFPPEMPPERRALLDLFRSKAPLIPHGIGLSIGSAQPIPEEKIEAIVRLCDLLDAPYYSDHFAITNDAEEDFSIGHLSPIWYTDESLRIITDKIQLLERRLGRPVVLENITSPFDLPESDYTEAEFITKVCERTSAGLLLDVTNVYINAYNRKTDPYGFLRALPLERVVQMHLAGGELHDGWFADTHSREIRGINEPIWPLFESAVRQSPNLRAVTIERDQNFGPDFETMILTDLRRIRQIWQPTAPEKAQ